MTRRVAGVALALGLVAVLGLAGGLVVRAKKRAVPRPDLALLTSLPLLFGERFGIEAAPPPIVARIERDYVLAPIAVADAASLRRHRLLLMAHPRAQPAEMLVELDSWVRGGGRVVVLADPLLRWESSRPIGDALRPPPDFADSGLLAHWGARLAIDAAGNGTVVATGPGCVVAGQGLVARCRVGQGAATIIADADFMMGEGRGAAAHGDLLMAELHRLESR